MPDEKKDANGSPYKSRTIHAIRGRRAIDDLFRSGRRLNGKHVTLVVGDAKGEESRLSVFVPRKLGNPVKRNRVRRVLREFIRTHPNPLMNGKKIIVLCKQPIDDKTLKETGEEIGRLLGRLAGDPKKCRP